MTIKHLTMALVVAAGVATGAIWSKVHAQVSPVKAQIQVDRFFISDLSDLDEGRVAYMFHDRKLKEVCFIVIENGNGGMAMAPRMC